jgi:hypothetical protein
MSGKRWFTVVCTALAATALGAGPARAQDPPGELIVQAEGSFDTPVGTTQDVSFSVLNHSNAPVRFQGVEIDPEPGATHAFTLDGPSTCPANGQLLAAYDVCKLTVRFAPQAAAEVDARLWVHTTRVLPGVKQEPPLDGDVYVPGLGFTISLPSAQDFGRQPVGLLSGAAAVTVATTGPAFIVRAHVSGPAADDFIVVANGCGQTLGSCDVRLRFAPSALGERTATLAVEALSGHTYTLTLTGYGVPLAAGPKGDKGDPGQPGTTGPEGPRGPAGQVTCRNTAAARLLCDALFAPGTWKPAAATTPARFTLSRGGHIRARGRATVNRDGRVRMRLSKPRRLHKGAYVLKVRVRHAVVLRRTLRIR